MNDIRAGCVYRIGDREVRRLGFGAMQLAGPGAFGPPKDRDAAIAVLRTAVAHGVNHIDTSDYYGPHVTNQLIAEALWPYPSDLTIVTKVGARRTEDASWLSAMKPKELVEAVYDNLRNLRLDALDVVNLRVMKNEHTPAEASIEESLTALAELQRQGLIRHLGISSASPSQVREARRIADVVCVQNHYNLVHRADDQLVDELAADGICYVPFFPLGRFSPAQSDQLSRLAAEVKATRMQVVLAWLLHRAPNMLLIPGTSSPTHLQENLAAGNLALPDEIIAALNKIGKV
jgi:pyridoxine 4-dehydrogenase